MRHATLTTLTTLFVISALPTFGQGALLNEFTYDLENEILPIDTQQKEIASDQYGIEAVTSWRSEYVYRGFDITANSMEFQLAGEIALTDNSSLDVGLFYGTASGKGDFSEIAGFLDYNREVGKYTFAIKLVLHDYSNSILKTGVDLEAGVNYQLNEAFDVSSYLSYNSGAEGVYYETKLSYFEQVNDDSYLVFDAGFSIVGDYYQRSGLNHVFSKLTYTYNINDSVSLSPYISGNIGIHEDAKNHLFGGVYFAVSF